MEYYLVVKQIHIITAVLSLLGFCLRAWWATKHNPLLNHRAVKTFPHINDTILLAAAIYLSFTSQIYPFVYGWLGAKVVLLIVYIISGAIAIKYGKTKLIKRGALAVALLSIVSIFAMAIYRPIF